MVKKIEDTFIRFDMIHERDRQTDRRTDGHRMLMHRIARQKLTKNQTPKQPMTSSRDNLDAALSSRERKLCDTVLTSIKPVGGLA